MKRLLINLYIKIKKINTIKPTVLGVFYFWSNKIGSLDSLSVLVAVSNFTIKHWMKIKFEIRVYDKIIFCFN